jgi:hypothetical protein
VHELGGGVILQGRKGRQQEQEQERQRYGVMVYVLGGILIDLMKWTQWQSQTHLVVIMDTGGIEMKDMRMWREFVNFE